MGWDKTVADCITEPKHQPLRNVSQHALYACNCAAALSLASLPQHRRRPISDLLNRKSGPSVSIAIHSGAYLRSQASQKSHGRSGPSLTVWPRPLMFGRLTKAPNMIRYRFYFCVLHFLRSIQLIVCCGLLCRAPLQREILPLVLF